VIASPLPTPSKPDNYALHWTAAVMAAAVLGGAPLWETRVERAGRVPPPAVAAGEARWFLTVRMPEVPVGEGAAENARRRVEEWLLALEREGFRPVRLSQAVKRLRAGEGLPEKSVALVFDPGYRSTYEALAPLLARRRWPATWVTDAPGLRAKDRRYVSLRDAREMSGSGWWDVGMKEKDPTRLTLLTREWGPVVLNGRGSALWAGRDGKYALNGGDPRRLRRLNANMAWSGQELVDRLLSERPLTGPARLGLRQIQEMRWGMVEPLSEDGDPGFELKTHPDGRGAAVYWLGTRGVTDLRVDLTVKSLMGELWLLLRSDEKAGEAVRVAFADGAVAVEEERGGVQNLVGGGEADELGQPASFTATVKLAGDRVEVWVDGRLCASAADLAVGGSGDAVTRLMIYEKVTGVARAESVSIRAEPLETASAWTEEERP
jgi:hypothetical protein